MPASSAFDPGSISAFVERSDLPVSFADTRDDEPLLYVNPAFERFTGHGATDCVGRNCRFLQGPSTDPVAVARVREGIDAREFRLTALSNHRADGAEFTNGLLVGPVNGADGETLALVGMQWEYPPHDRLPNWTEAGTLLPFPMRPYGHGLLDRLRVEDRPGIVAVDVAYALSMAVHALARATWERSTPYDRVARGTVLDTFCRPTSFRGEPVLELLWQVPGPRGANSEPAAARARAGLEVAARLFERLGGTFEFELDNARLDAVLRLPNRPLEVLDDD